eukprot:3780377-Rhodomonas_salina.2
MSQRLSLHVVDRRSDQRSTTSVQVAEAFAAATEARESTHEKLGVVFGVGGGGAGPASERWRGQGMTEGLGTGPGSGAR